MNMLGRRAVLVLPALAAAPASAQVSSVGPVAQPAEAESFEAAERAILAGRTPVTTGIEVEVPRLSENGNSVDISVKVDSPFTAEDHVTAIHILSERNPYPRVASFGLSARSGRAEVATRIRLATSQNILVLAETSRGQVRRASRDVIVILGACVEGG